jgi:hypothetical protein
VVGSSSPGNENLKDDLELRPIYHQLIGRIEAHIFVAFLAYCLQVTLRARLRPLASGLTPRLTNSKRVGCSIGKSAGFSRQGTSPEQVGHVDAIQP